jgi:hypothetical protein
MARVDDVFTVLKVIRRSVDQTRELTEPARNEAVNSRVGMLVANLSALITAKLTTFPLAHLNDEPIFVLTHAEILEATATVEELDTLCRRVTAERDALVKELVAIRRDLDAAGIVPRTRNLGEGARGTDATSAPSH